MQLTKEQQDMLANLNYDLNIWNEGWHNSEHLAEEEQYSQWKISLHNVQQLPDGHIQTGDWIEDLSLDITEEEASRLTLGYGDGDLIGDYTADSDFFLDIDAFFTIYKDIPERIVNWLLELPPLEIQPSNW